ncbi:MAG: hypothetical protein QOE70_5354 [Chthoniobacter sp.]|jgi:hypothetical protein|nr:hypothetical protein [Chthoniobacter sp.]
MANTETFGEHQEAHVGRWSADRRGLISGSVQRHVKEPYDKVDFALLNLKAAPKMLIPCVGVTRDYQSPYGVYTYSYEGIDPSQGDDESLITFELDITMEEVSIEAHPNLDAIEKIYGRFDPRLKRFTQRYLSSSGSSGLNGDGAAESRKINPLYGTDSFLCFGATFKKSYVRKAIPPSALRGIGTIIARPIGLSSFPLPAAAKHRKWLKLAPKITLRGNCVQIEENYIMSGRHGIVKEIYGSAQLEEEGDAGSEGGSALTSGTL